MRVGRVRTLAAIVALLLSTAVFPSAAPWLGLLALLATATFLVALFRYARSNCGTGYAVRHLVLAVGLLPVLWIGPFLASWLVEADVEKTHVLADEAAEVGTATK